MTGFYLRHPVEVIEWLAGGWCRCRWADGRVWKHWAEQITTEPYGHTPVKPLDH